MKEKQLLCKIGETYHHGKCVAINSGGNDPLDERLYFFEDNGVITMIPEGALIPSDTDYEEGDFSL